MTNKNTNYLSVSGGGNSYGIGKVSHSLWKCDKAWIIRAAVINLPTVQWSEAYEAVHVFIYRLYISVRHSIKSFKVHLCMQTVRS